MYRWYQVETAVAQGTYCNLIITISMNIFILCSKRFLTWPMLRNKIDSLIFVALLSNLLRNLTGGVELPFSAS